MKVKQLSGLSPRDRYEIGMENFAKKLSDHRIFMVR